MNLVSLTKTYPDGTEAVKGINLDVEESKFVVLLGPSGCGKTTTLRMIAGLETPTSGSISVSGQHITELAPSDRDVGFVFQFYALYPHLNAGDNIAFPLDNQNVGREERDRRVNETAERLGILALLGQYPGQLSDGDQQRVSLARAMVRNPSIYLMDEPLGQLDANIRLDLREAIRSQQLDTGVTTVYVTHDQEEALSLADVVVVMNAGRIEQVGSPDEVYHRPKSLFVADFVGSPGMNLFEGIVESNGSQATFKSNGSSLSIGGCDYTGTGTLGIRPESVRITPNGPLSGSVSVSEYFGDHHIIHLATDWGMISARSRSPGVPGEAARVSIDLDHLCLYNDSGVSVR